MRNWAAERPVVKGVRVYGNTTSCGAVNPYNELVDRLGDAAKTAISMDPTMRAGWKELAWFLGMNGETHACESIMEHAKEPVAMMHGCCGYPPVD